MPQHLGEGIQPPTVTVSLPSTALLCKVLILFLAGCTNTGNIQRLFLMYIVLITPERVTHTVPTVPSSASPP